MSAHTRIQLGVDRCARVPMLLNGGARPHAQVMQAIELLGTKVAPLVRQGLGDNLAPGSG